MEDGRGLVERARSFYIKDKGETLNYLAEKKGQKRALKTKKKGNSPISRNGTR